MSTNSMCVGVARERDQREAVGQVEDRRGKSLVRHVRRTSVGQAVRDDDKSRGDAGQTQGVSDVGQSVGSFRLGRPGHTEPSSPGKVFQTVVARPNVWRSAWPTDACVIL